MSIANASATPASMAHAARYQPGAVQRERGWWTGAWAWTGAVAVAIESVLLSGLEQILYECVDLLRAEPGLEIRGHYALRVTRCDYRVRVLDRLLDEGGALGGDAVQLGSDRAGRTGIGERVAGAAAALTGEDRLALGGGRSPATTAG